MPNYWFRQTPDKPLFPDLLWSRPENKAHAGKLLIVGGNAHGFAAPAETYNEASKAGAGTMRVILPEAVRKVAGAVLPEVEFAPNTPSGSFSQLATAEVLSAAEWADGVLLAGDFGHNSETAILLEKVVAKHNGQLTLTKDSLDNLIGGQTPLGGSNMLFVITMAQLQKLAIQLKATKAITLSMDLVQLVDALHELTTTHDLLLIVKHLDKYLVAVNGQVSTTQLATDQKMWRVRTAARAAVWWLQNPGKAFEALTTSLIEP